jgi:HAD superfamily hydrolase (TIGR01549 family)
VSVRVQLSAPRMLLLDAGNTVIFLDHEAVASAAARAGVAVDARVLREREVAAKDRYAAAMTHGVSHEDGWHLFMAVLYEAAGCDPSSADRAAREARRAHEELGLWRTVPAELPEALARVQRAGVRTAIISNSEGKLESLLRRLGVDHLFEFVLDSGIEGVRKPDPEIFRRALARGGVRPEEALYAGDIPEVDVDGPRAVGIDAVLIDPWDHYPDYRAAPRFASVAELVRAFGL